MDRGGVLSPAAVIGFSPRARGWSALAAVVLLGVLMMLPGAMHGAYHCDEVNVFRHVTDFAAGQFVTPGRPGLLWMALVPFVWVGDALTSIHLLRATAVVASALTLALVAGLAGRRSDGGWDVWSILGAGGLLATSLGWQTHAFEVRTDTYTAPLTLAAAALLLRPVVSTRAAVAAGAAMAAAGLVSQKSIYNAVALASAWAIFHLVTSRPIALRVRARTAGIAVGTATGLVAAWYGGMSLVTGSADFITANLDTAMSTGFSEVWGFTKNRNTLGSTAGRAPVLWGLALPALVVAAVSRKQPVHLAVGVMGAVMVATIFVHRGFRPYFVASFEPYLAVLSGGLLGSLCGKLHARARTLPAGMAAIAAALPVFLAFGGTAYLNRTGTAALLATDNEHQLRVVREVMDAFPEPVPYWDSIGLILGYPETTFFGTGPTRTAKRKKMRGNMYVRLAREAKPRFFIRDYMTRDGYLKNDERRWIWRHFLPYRPNLYLLGGRIQAQSPQSAGPVEVLVAGEYTVRFLGDWTGSASVDGRPVQDGDVISLSEGHAQLAVVATEGTGDLAIYLGRDRVPAKGRAAEVDWSMYPRLRRDRFQQYDRRGKPADLLTPEQDPTMTPKKHRSRRRKHDKAREKRRRALATP
jgi:hypothetical protein